MAVDRLVNRVSHWSPTRWSQPARPGLPVRSDLVFALVQNLADLAADADGHPRRPVPRLASDLALPDQVRVMLADLLAQPRTDELLESARVLIRDTAGALDG